MVGGIVCVFSSLFRFSVELWLCTVVYRDCSTVFKNMDISFSLLVRTSFIQFQYLKYEMLKQNKI
jgi:hypothetical protein